MPERSREISRCERKISCMAERSLYQYLQMGILCLGIFANFCDGNGVRILLSSYILYGDI